MLRGQAGGDCSGSRCTLRAYTPILRRDPLLNEKMQKFIRQQVRLWKRQRGLPEDDSEVKKKNAYLAKLGLASKIVDASTIPPWHLNHLAPGDVYEGGFEHPEMNDGDRMDLTFTVNSPTEGTIESDKGNFEEKVSIKQDFSITFGKGEARARDQTAYIFCKFNPGWRDFGSPMPPDEECFKHINHKMLQLWFQQATQVEGFPSEAEFRENAADPDKGMTMEEFLAYTTSDDSEYIDKTFKGIFTGRRIQFAEEDLKFDGDFAEAKGNLVGFVSASGREGGTFDLELKSD